MFESKELLDKVKYLESERVKLWDRVTKLEKDVKENASTHEMDAKNSSKKAAEFRNKAEDRKNSIETLFIEAELTLTKLKFQLKEAENTSEYVKKVQLEVDGTVGLLNEKSEALEEKLDKIEAVLTEHPSLEDEIDILSTQLSNSEANSSKISVLLKGITERKNEIDEIYYEVAGYDEKDEDTEEVQHIAGLKDKLKEQYDGLTLALKNLRKDFDELLKDKTQETQTAINDWNGKYDSLIKKIESLLPNALTAGLSSAYSKKKDDEIINYEKLKNQFEYGIMGLIGVSLLSVFISIYFIYRGTGFFDVIKILPNLASAIIPLYIPILWYTFSANKKLNLSKRLIEEYTHKEVLGKTFEGLSTQINNLDENEISKELKFKLLFNILEVSTENPGKLISDYKNTDHPILEVINQQSKLEQAYEKAKDFPGIKKLSDFIEDKKLNKKKEQVEKLIDDVKEIVKE